MRTSGTETLDLRSARCYHGRPVPNSRGALRIRNQLNWNNYYGLLHRPISRRISASARGTARARPLWLHCGVGRSFHSGSVVVGRPSGVAIGASASRVKYTGYKRSRTVVRAINRGVYCATRFPLTVARAAPPGHRGPGSRTLGTRRHSPRSAVAYAYQRRSSLSTSIAMSNYFRRKVLEKDIKF